MGWPRARRRGFGGVVWIEVRNSACRGRGVLVGGWEGEGRGGGHGRGWGGWRGGR